MIEFERSHQENDPTSTPGHDADSDHVGVRVAAAEYIDRGFAVVPVLFKSKRTTVKDWPKLRIVKADVAAYFPERSNVGLLLGDPSGNLIDVDLDSSEAVALATSFLPETHMVSGRPGAPRSHHWYRSEGADLSSQKFVDPSSADGERACLVEIRFTGAQTLVPPSIHPSGEPYEWHVNQAPSTVVGAELLKGVQHLAAASLLVRHYPKSGSRNDFALALGGALLTGRMDAAVVEKFVATVARAAGDDEWASRARSVNATATKIREGRPVTGGPALEQFVGEKVVTVVKLWLGLSNAGTRSVVGIGDDVEVEVDTPMWPGEIHEAAFYGIAGRFVRVMEPHTEADPAALLSQFLVMAGNVVGRGPHVLADGARHGTNLYAVQVGRSSRGRKGSSLQRVRSIFEKIDPSWISNCLLYGLSSGEGLISFAAGEQDEGDADGTGASTSGKKSGKRKSSVPSDERVLFVESELGRSLRAARREGSTLTAVLRQGWDGDVLQIATRQNALRVEGVLVSGIGHITVQELNALLQSVDVYNGFTNRCLWFCVQRSKVLPYGSSPDETYVGEIVQQMNSIVVWSRRDVGRIAMDAGSRAIWEKLYPVLTRDRLGLFGDASARGEAQVLRLAVVYAVLDKSKFIRREHLIAALAVWEYVEASLFYIFGKMLGNRVAERLLALISSRPEGVTRKEIRDHLQRNRQAADIENQLRFLAQLNLVTRESRATGGRAAEVWRLLRREAAEGDFGRFGRATPYVAMALETECPKSAGVGETPILSSEQSVSEETRRPCADGEDKKGSNGRSA